MPLMFENLKVYQKAVSLADRGAAETLLGNRPRLDSFLTSRIRSG